MNGSGFREVRYVSFGDGDDSVYEVGCVGAIEVDGEGDRDSTLGEIQAIVGPGGSVTVYLRWDCSNEAGEQLHMVEEITSSRFTIVWMVPILPDGLFSDASAS